MRESGSRGGAQSRSRARLTAGIGCEGQVDEVCSVEPMVGRDSEPPRENTSRFSDSESSPSPSRERTNLVPPAQGPLPRNRTVAAGSRRCRLSRRPACQGAPAPRRTSLALAAELEQDSTFSANGGVSRVAVTAEAESQAGSGGTWQGGEALPPHSSGAFCRFQRDSRYDSEPETASSNSDHMTLLQFVFASPGAGWA